MNNSMNNVNLEIKRLIIGFLLKEKIQNQTHRWYEEYMENDYKEYYRQKQETIFDKNFEKRLDDYLQFCKADERISKAINQDVLQVLDDTIDEYAKKVNKR